MTLIDERADSVVAPSWWAAREAAHACADPLGTEAVPLAEAVGRVLASDVRSLTPLPAFDTSAMDGWAVSGAGPWTVVGSVLAGAEAGTLHDGQAVVIATGARLPSGASGVLRSEDGAVVGRGLDGRVRDGDHVRRAGEECRAGELLIHAGTRVRPVHAGLAAAAGHDVLAVRRQPRASVLVLGDELLVAGPARGGGVRDALGPQLPGWLEALGTRPPSVSHVRDTEPALVAALDAAAGSSDLVITTGGTAAGPVDHLHRAIAAVDGRLVVDSVAVRPGHPMLLALLPGDVPLVGLPGNPQAAIAGLATLVAPVVDALAARALRPLREVLVATAVPAPARSTRLVPAQLDGHHGCPVGNDGPAMLRGLAASDGWLVVPPGGVAAGVAVPWLPLPS
jgi:molybdopterin molybdotransferase